MTVPESPDKYPPGAVCAACTTPMQRVLHPRDRPHGTTISLLLLVLALVAGCTPPRSEAADTTTKPATTTTVAPTTTALRLVRPATVYAPAVRVDPPPPHSTVTPTIEDEIRAIWPDHLEGRALKIAYRESRYQCCVRTWCCYGVFQIHEIHLSWLDEYGVTSVWQLYDPVTNIEAAYELYLRDGWAPWQT